MKKNKSNNKKLVSAAGMFLLSAAMLGSATYAWFTMSRTVKVDGMEVKTKVSGNLLISDTNASDAYYGTQLSQSVKAYLEPVSTINGSDGSFYYTLDAKADGSKLHAPVGTSSGSVPFVAYDASAAATDTSTYANKFSEDYGITKTVVNAFETDHNGAAQGYVDYVFYLKANADSENNEIRLTRCNLSYNDRAISNSGSDKTAYDKAWRVAVFSTATSVGTTSATPASSSAISILGLDDAAYFSDKAVSAVDNTGTVSMFSTPVVIDTNLAAGSVSYYKVIVRLWLEGQDTACKTDTYADLTNSWKLDLQFDMVPTSDNTLLPVTEIGTDAPATINDDVPRPRP